MESIAHAKRHGNRKFETLELPEKNTNVLRFKEVSTEVDYELDGSILEIRVWSEEFNIMVPIQESYLRNKFTSKYTDLLVKIQETIEGAINRPKEFNSDDLTPPPAA